MPANSLSAMTDEIREKYKDGGKFIWLPASKDKKKVRRLFSEKTKRLKTYPALTRQIISGACTDVCTQWNSVSIPISS